MLKLMAIGRLTADPDIRTTQGPNPLTVARFNIAVDRRVKREGQPEADFHSCIAFGKPADFIGKYFSKGMKIVLEGDLQNNNYTDQQGVKHYGYQIVVNSVEFAESKRQQDAAPAYKNAAPAQPSYNDGFMQIPDGVEDEGLPFN